VLQALARAAQVGNPRAQAVCYHALGAVRYLAGRWTESTEALGRSIELARSVGSTFGVVLGMQRLAVVETGQGRYQDAHDRLVTALALMRSSDDPLVLSHSPVRLFTSLTENRLRAGNLAGAAQCLAEGYAAQRAVLAEGFGVCATCDVLLYPAAVAVHLARGERDEAERAGGEAERAATWFHSRVWRATARYLRGLLAEAEAEPSSAAPCFEEAAAQFRKAGQPYDLARCLEALARVTGDERPRQEAYQLYKRLGATADARRLD
jgi:tetratricopeptide (TPR) repeat protein